MSETNMRSKKGLFIRQRALLKSIIISSVKNNSHYGLELKKNIFLDFEEYGYEPTNSEIYKSLFELVSSGILDREEKVVKGSTYETVVVYKIRDKEKADYYLNLVLKELIDNRNMIEDVLNIINPLKNKV